MKCRNCGAENQDNAQFCRRCGHNQFINTNISTTKSGINPLLIVLSIIIVLIVLMGGAFAYIVYFDTSPVEVTQLSTDNNGNILANSEIASNLPESDISTQITNLTNTGVPVYKIGDGQEPVTVITTGVHGDQLVPCIAAMQMINYLDGRKIKGTVYIIPFTSPEAVSKNTKLTNGVNLNTAADEAGTISYNVVNYAIANNASAVGDFHETELGKDPGVTTIMCSQLPTPGSYDLANNMSSLTLDTTLNYQVAGIAYDGAIEDELNLKNVPAVTPLVQVPNHGKVYHSAVSESYDQMLALLIANGNLDPNDKYLKLANADIDGF